MSGWGGVQAFSIGGWVLGLGALRSREAGPKEPEQSWAAQEVGKQTQCVWGGHHGACRPQQTREQGLGSRTCPWRSG